MYSCASSVFGIVPLTVVETSPFLKVMRFVIRYPCCAEAIVAAAKRTSVIESAAKTLRPAVQIFFAFPLVIILLSSLLIAVPDVAKHQPVFTFLFPDDDVFAFVENFVFAPVKHVAADLVNRVSVTTYFNGFRFDFLHARIPRALPKIPDVCAPFDARAVRRQNRGVFRI